MSRALSVVMIIAAFVLAGAQSVSRKAGSDYDLSWHTIASGGTASGGSFDLAATLGQPAATRMSGGGFTFDGGFGPGGVRHPCPIQGDVNCDRVVNVSDLLLVIINWGSVCEPEEDCLGDANADDVVNVFDLLVVITNWGDIV